MIPNFNYFFLLNFMRRFELKTSFLLFFFSPFVTNILMLILYIYIYIHTHTHTWTHVVLRAMIGWRQNGNCPCFLWDFHLLSSCHRHLICLFTITGNICRNKPKTNGLKIKRNSKQLSRKDIRSKQISLRKPEILFIYIYNMHSFNILSTSINFIIVKF